MDTTSRLDQSKVVRMVHVIVLVRHLLRTCIITEALPKCNCSYIFTMKTLELLS